MKTLSDKQKEKIYQQPNHNNGKANGSPLGEENKK